MTGEWMEAPKIPASFAVTGCCLQFLVLWWFWLVHYLSAILAYIHCCMIVRLIVERQVSLLRQHVQFATQKKKRSRLTWEEHYTERSTRADWRWAHHCSSLRQVRSPTNTTLTTTLCHVYTYGTLLLQPFYGSLDNPAEPVPEETFTHSRQ